MISFIKRTWKVLLCVTILVFFIIYYISAKSRNISLCEMCEIKNISILFIPSALKTVILISFLFVIISLILVTKHGLHNVRRCDIECFDKIDDFKKNSKDNYIIQIEYINLSYAENGEVDKLIENRELFKLYSRMDFLTKGNMLFNDLNTCFSSLAISILASLMVIFFDSESQNMKSPLYLIAFAVFILCFFVVSMIKYYQRGEFGSLKYKVFEYEIVLLQQKIRGVEENPKMKKEDEQFLFTKKFILDYLIKQLGQCKLKLNKNKKEIENDIKIIEKLNLYLDNYSKYIVKEYILQDSLNKHKDCKEKKVYLVYKKSSKKKQKLVNNDYKKLSDILDKYNLIQVKA